ncbi:MAG: DUF4296 domain-containing protein [Flavobacteriaceae bacterium]|nr:DUF4296 domain-containing protein [Flavobacteriaceae bacterium]
MKRIIYIVIFIFLVACDSKIKYKKPENLIPKNQMIDLLYDMHLANGATSIKTTKFDKGTKYMSLVYEKYKIDSIQFALSNTYYIANIDEYEEIFIEVERRLKTLKNKYEAKRDTLFKKDMKSDKLKKSLDKYMKKAE